MARAAYDVPVNTRVEALACGSRFGGNDAAQGSAS